MGQIEDLAKFDRQFAGGSGTAPEEKLFLYGLVRMMRPEVVVEIGSRAGHSAAWIALALKHNGGGHVICVDTFEGRMGGGGGSQKKVLKRLRANRVAKFAKVFVSDSQKFLKAMKTGSAELVFVDGAHDEKSAAADIKEASRVASKLVVVHDAMNLVGVTKACKAARGGTWVAGCRGMWMKSKAGICPRTKKTEKSKSTD